jgi:hypothetical protein
MLLIFSSQENQVVPITQRLNQVLTRKIAGYHAKLDEIGSSILLKKMMTFITVKVLLILILTEQLGFCLSKLAQEGMQESANGILTFPFTIRNQFTTSLSSLQAAYEMRKELLNIKETFI